MAKYIDKNALVAEIEKIRRIEVTNNDVAYNGALDEIKYFLDTLEVKEVDLNKYYHDFLQKEWFTPHVRTVSEMMAFTAKHFFELGLKIQKEYLWKPADGDELPEIDREVIALLDNGKVVFAHRPPEYWDGKDIVTGKVTRNYPKTYDKGGWNIPDVKYWLDCSMLKEIEL